VFRGTKKTTKEEFFLFRVCCLGCGILGLFLFFPQTMTITTEKKKCGKMWEEQKMENNTTNNKKAML